MTSIIRRYEITDAEWEHIKPYIPEEQKAGTRGRPSKDSGASSMESSGFCGAELHGEIFPNGMAHGKPYIVFSAQMTNSKERQKADKKKHLLK